jgi:predicted transcriptional regulator of viral defense system
MSMSPNNSRYSHSQGLTLLESAVQEFGPIFTLDQLKPLARAQQLSDAHLRFLISSLASAGWIEIIKRGVYVVKSPLYSGEIPPFAIASALIHPMAISHWSACAHHGFTTQSPTMIQASTPKKVITPEMRTGKANNPRGRAIWLAFGLEFEFVHMKQDLFWGFDKIWVSSWQQVNITDPERTALDLIARSDIFGGISAAIEILEIAVGQIEIDRLVEYALRYDTGSVIKRLGWALERLEAPEQNLEPLTSYPVSRYYPLDPSHDEGAPKNIRWHVLENLRRS